MRRLWHGAGVALLIAGAPAMLAHSPAGAMPFDPDGTQVEGAVRDVDAPVLAPGQYASTFPVNNEPRYFRVQRTVPGSTIHVGATTRLADAAPAASQIWLWPEERSSDIICGHTTTLATATAFHNDLVSGAANTWMSEPDDVCNTADEIVVEIFQTDTELANLPFELVVYEEPPLASGDGLAPVDTTVSWESMSTGPAEAGPTPGTGFTDAPVLDPGSYTFEIEGGQAQVFAIPLDWGQHLQAELETEALSDTSGTDSSRLDASIFGPLGEHVTTVLDVEDVPEWPTHFGAVSDGGPFRTGAVSPITSFLNRTDEDVAAGGLAGPHFVQVTFKDSEDWGSMRYTLTVQPFGTAGEGTPAYADTDGLRPPPPPDRSDLLDTADVRPASSTGSDHDTTQPSATDKAPESAPTASAGTNTHDPVSSAGDRSGANVGPLLLGITGCALLVGGIMGLNRAFSRD